MQANVNNLERILTMRTITKITIFCAILIPALILGFSSFANAQEGAPTPPLSDWWGEQEVCPKWEPVAYPGVATPSLTCVFEAAVEDGPADPTPTAVPMLIRRPGRGG